MPVNAEPDDPVTILRLLSELEGTSNFVAILPDTDEEIAFLNKMKAKYYKLYFKLKKNESKQTTEKTNETTS